MGTPHRPEPTGKITFAGDSQWAFTLTLADTLTHIHLHPHTHVQTLSLDSLPPVPADAYSAHVNGGPSRGDKLRRDVMVGEIFRRAGIRTETI